MENYRIQDGCSNCKKAFRKMDYEADTLYYCHADKSDRPKCGSTLQKEEFWELPQPEFKILFEKWMEWSMPRSVSSFGICDLFEDEEE